MLLPDNIHPELSIYYNGSLVIKALRKNDKQPLLGLYENIKAIADISLSTYILCLDWLYLIDVVNVTESGRVELCISKD